MLDTVFGALLLLLFVFTNLQDMVPVYRWGKWHLETKILSDETSAQMQVCGSEGHAHPQTVYWIYYAVAHKSNVCLLEDMYIIYIHIYTYTFVYRMCIYIYIGRAYVCYSCGKEKSGKGIMVQISPSSLAVITALLQIHGFVFCAGSSLIAEV